MEQNLKQLEKFFKYDLNIKEILHDCRLKEEDTYNSIYCLKYKEKLYNSLKDIEFYITRIIEMFYPNNNYISKNIKKKFKAYYYSVIKCSLDKNKLKNLYKTIFSDMSEELIKNLKENHCGYLFNRDYQIIEEATSINEILHIFHHLITNTEGYYQNLPIINSKENYETYPITLRGQSNEVATDIYNKFPLDIECGWTDIIGLKNKVLMMIRDRGHALTIELNIEEEKVMVKYYIPKICNIEMVNALKGVTKVTESDKYTVGFFLSTKEEIAKEIATLISMVPTDMDMIMNRKH